MDAEVEYRNLLIFHILSPGRVMLPLNQSRLFTDVTPNSVRKTMSLVWIDTRHSGLLLDCLEEFVLVDLAVKLSEHILALIVM